jgi:hypothetical protein
MIINIFFFFIDNQMREKSPSMRCSSPYSPKSYKSIYNTNATTTPYSTTSPIPKNFKLKSHRTVNNQNSYSNRVSSIPTTPTSPLGCYSPNSTANYLATSPIVAQVIKTFESPHSATTTTTTKTQKHFRYPSIHNQSNSTVPNSPSSKTPLDIQKICVGSVSSVRAIYEERLRNNNNNNNTNRLSSNMNKFPRSTFNNQQIDNSYPISTNYLDKIDKSNHKSTSNNQFNKINEIENDYEYMNENESLLDLNYDDNEDLFEEEERREKPSTSNDQIHQMNRKEKGSERLQQLPTSLSTSSSITMSISMSTSASMSANEVFLVPESNNNQQNESVQSNPIEIDNNNRKSGHSRSISSYLSKRAFKSLLPTNNSKQSDSKRTITNCLSTQLLDQSRIKKNIETEEEVFIKLNNPVPSVSILPIDNSTSLPCYSTSSSSSTSSNSYSPTSFDIKTMNYMESLAQFAHFDLTSFFFNFNQIKMIHKNLNNPVSKKSGASAASQSKQKSILIF